MEGCDRSSRTKTARLLNRSKKYGAQQYSEIKRFPLPSVGSIILETLTNYGSN